MAHKTFSDEEIIAALIANGSITAAAKAAGCSPRTIYDRLNDRGFVAAYDSAKLDILRGAVFDLAQATTAAAATLGEIVADKEVNPQTRVLAAQTIFEQSRKTLARLGGDERRQREMRPTTLSEMDIFDKF